MSLPHDHEVKLFSAALALAPGARSAYLDQACTGDAHLRRRIEQLIEAHEAAGGAPIMGAQPAGSPPDPEMTTPPLIVPEESAGTWIGRYKLLQKLGEGGCGVVWMAEQNEPVHRRVALKVIKLGMDTKTVIARFDAERQALAIMDHANIAHALDAGATETGRPYFVMELVRGVRITDFCDQHSLSTTQRLELFTQVCSAIQHAHQKGIIHRDIKPSNILVTLIDGVPVTKVIDFGIAKATQGRLTDLTVFTAFEQFIGTPAYMSPEQAEMTGIDIDTRSDIYSLGVLLYELLTGRPPFDPKTLLQAGLDEIRRIIREVEPPKPSTNLSTLNDTDRRTLAKQRSTDPVRLSLLLRGDLDWIVMKALEKNRTRRYATASDLAADIARHLHDEPVAARPPSTTYRLGKLIRRHRLAFVAVVAVTLALLAGLATSTWQAVRATRAELAASRERATAEAERARAEDLLSFMLGDLRTQVAKVGRLDVLESVSDKALAYFASRETTGLDDPALVRHAKALTQIGQIRMDQARYAEASAAFTEAHRRTAALSARHPRDGNILFERGQAEYWVGFMYWKKGELAAAAEWLQRYSDTCAALVTLDPARADWRREHAYGQHNLAVLAKDRGDLATARTGFLAELAALEKLAATEPANLELTFDIADTHSWLGVLAERQGNFPEALQHYSTKLTLLERLAQAEPATAKWQFQLADTHLLQADILLATGGLAAATQQLQTARRLLDKLTALDPANRRWQVTALTVSLREAMLAGRRDDLTAAKRTIEEIRPQFEQLLTAEPTDRTFVRWLAKAWIFEAGLKETDRPEARAAAAKAVELGERLIREGRAEDNHRGECAQAHVVAGDIADRAGDAATARQHWQRTMELVQPQLSDTRYWLLLDPTARALTRLGRADEAQAIIAKLTLLGYVPLDPWPAAGQPAAVKSIHKTITIPQSGEPADE